MSNQITDLLASQADGDDDFDWSVSANWLGGVPQYDADVVADIAGVTSLDNISGLTLSELDLENGAVVLSDSLTVGTLDLGDAGPVSLTVASGAFAVSAIDDAGASGQINVESDIYLASTATSTTIDVPLHLGASAVAAIDDGWTVNGGVVFDAAGATLKLTGLSSAVTVTGASGLVELKAASANVEAGDERVYFTGGYDNNGSRDDSVSLSGTAGGWDTVFGNDGAISIASADVSINGAAETVSANAGCWVSFYANGAQFTGSNDYLIINEQGDTINGADDLIMAPYGGQATLNVTSGDWDTAYATDVQFTIVGNATIVGGGNLVGGGNSTSFTASLWNTDDDADTVDGGGLGVVLNADFVLNDAQAKIFGGSNQIWAYGASSMTLLDTVSGWDTVYGSNLAITFDDKYDGVSQASILGGGNTISTMGAADVSLYNTDGAADTIAGSDDLIILNSAQASLSGGGDMINFAGDSSISVSSQYDAFQFAAALGNVSITGFNSTDTIHLNTADWSSFSALQSSGDLSESDNNAIIRLDASDAIALVGVQASALTSAEFVFSSAAYS